MTGNQVDAQDVVQEAYIRAWRDWDRIGEFERAESWVRLVVTRLATDRWRRLKVRWRIEAAQRPPEPAPPPSENTVLLTQALRRLPLAQRRAVCLHYLLDLPVDEVAVEVGAPVGTVKAWLSRARTTLAQQLAPSAPSA